MGLVTFEIKPRSQAPRHVHIQSALKRAMYVLDIEQDMIRAWSGLVSDLLKHPETQDHPVIWEGTKRITDGKVFTINGLRELIERTAKAEKEQK